MLKGGVDGWGMMQLTRFATKVGGELRKPIAQELWSWKANIDTAIAVLQVKKAEVESHLKSIAPDGAGGYIIPPNITVSGVKFRKGTAKTPDQLGVIKRYNGGYFWTDYDSMEDKWTHIPLQSEGSQNKDYTEKVLDEYES